MKSLDWTKKLKDCLGNCQVSCEAVRIYYCFNIETTIYWKKKKRLAWKMFLLINLCELRTKETNMSRQLHLYKPFANGFRTNSSLYSALLYDSSFSSLVHCKVIGIYCISVNLTCNARSSNHLYVEVSITEIRVFLNFLLTFYLRFLSLFLKLSFHSF